MIAKTFRIFLVMLLCGILQSHAQGTNPYHYIFPVMKNVETTAGIPVQIPIFIENSGSSTVTLSVSVSGDPEFSVDSLSQSMLLDPGQPDVALIQFMSTTPGSYSTLLTVTDGTLSDTITLSANVNPPPGPFVLLPPFHDIMADVGTATQVPITIQNVTGNAYPVTVTLAGDAAFSYAGSQTVSLAADGSETVYVDFLSNAEGHFSATLEVSDGSYTTSAPIKVYAMNRPYKWVVPFQDEFSAPAGVQMPIPVFVQNTAANPVTLDVALSGDAEFSLDPASRQVTVTYGEDLRISFLSNTAGTYTTLLTVTDGVHTDSLTLTMHVSSGTGGTLFTTQYDGMDFFFPFEAAPAASVTRDLTITNISGSQLSLQLDLFSDSSFTVSASSITIDDGASETVQVTFDNSYGGFGSGMLVIDGGNQVEQIFLVGFTRPWTDFDGLLVMNNLDFGMVDTSTQVCRDVLLENTTQSAIAISNIQLSGFSSDFSLPYSSGFTIGAGETASIPVCFQPSVVNQVRNEVLTFTFDNPASTPNLQTASVNLTGRASTGILPPWIDSSSIISVYVNTISAPIDGSSEVEIELYNVSSQSITINNAFWEDGNNAGIYSLLTPLPITIQPHNPSVPSSGKSTITVKYAPTSQSSTVGVEDIATLRFESSSSSVAATYFLTLIGTPISPAPASLVIAMFPKDGRIPKIALGEADVNSTHSLRFENNLQVPVTISGLALSSDERFEVAGTASLPRTVAPGETIAVELRTRSVAYTRSTDALIMHGSHEHLNSRYEILSGSSVTGVEDVPQRPETFSMSVAPNPTAGPVSIVISSPLRQGRIQVMDMLGRLVAEFNADTRTLQWNGTTAAGRRADPGTYYIRATGTDVNGQAVAAIHKVLLLP
ncbi:MAG: hypothetical protein KFH87_09120 [Bacteroidetes bacterium]|nr:hypothetical protein [Bacteroidota bacterium]